MDGTSKTVITILGGTGDLAARRIMPALYTLYKKNALPSEFRIVGISRKDIGVSAYKMLLTTSYIDSEPCFDSASWNDFLSHIDWIRGDVSNMDTYRLLGHTYFSEEDVNALFYFACMPEHFGDAARCLAETGLAGKQASGIAYRRIMIEKPFGTDLDSARRLNTLLHAYYDEADIFRIDHYLGKDAVQNILYFRFANSIFEPLWNRKYIDRVEISVSESGGIGLRGGFYDATGAARDMLQNHLMQLFCLCAMEPPENIFSQEAVREEKVRLLRAVPDAAPEDIPALCVRGQYKGYRAEQSVSETSRTETFAAIRLDVDNWRWSGVPFILASGKALGKHKSEISVYFKQGNTELEPDANQLILRIQPDEGIVLRFNVKKAGTECLEREELISAARGQSSVSQGPYERLLAAALSGDSGLFIRFDETEEAWRLIDPVLKHWNASTDAPLVYPKGSGGPDTSFLANGCTVRVKKQAVS